MLSLSSLLQWVRFREPPEPDPRSTHILALGRITNTKVPDSFATFVSRRDLTSSPRHQTQSPLLSLPVEIRWDIWALVAGPKRTVDVFEDWRTKRILGKDAISGSQIALLCACKQAYIEVLPMLLRMLHIKATRPWPMMRLPELLAPNQMDMIKSVELCWELPSPYIRYSYEQYTSGQLKYKPKPRFQYYCGTRNRDRDRASAVRLKGVCEVLKAMQGLEEVTLEFCLVHGDDLADWNHQEALIVDLVNEARQGRHGWKLLFRLDFGRFCRIKPAKRS